MSESAPPRTRSAALAQPPRRAKPESRIPRFGFWASANRAQCDRVHHSPGGRVPEFGTRTGAPFEFFGLFRRAAQKCCLIWLGERQGGGCTDFSNFFGHDAGVAEEHHRAGVRGADRGTRSLEGGPVPQLAGEHQPQALHL